MKTRQKLSWLGIEGEAEVQLAELEATLEENAETEQDDSAADSDDSTQFPPIVSSITIDKAKQMLLDVCKFAASIGCSEAQDHPTSGLLFLN